MRELNYSFAFFSLFNPECLVIRSSWLSACRKRDYIDYATRSIHEIATQLWDVEGVRHIDDVSNAHPIGDV